MIDVRHNAHIRSATLAARPTRWPVALVAAVGFVLASEALGVAIPQDVVDPARGSIGSVVLDGLAGLVLIALVVVWLRVREVRPGRSVGFRGPRPALRFAAGVLIGGVMLAGGTLLMLALGGIDRVAHPPGTSTGTSALLAVVLVGVAWALQATSEEVVIRGFVFQWCGLQLPAGPAILVPAVAFVALHLATPGALAPLPLVNLALFALLAAFVTLADRGLLLIAGIHTGWNWAQGNMMGMRVGGALQDHALVVFAPVDGTPGALSGGDFGLDATLGATVVLLIATAVTLSVLVGRRPSPGVKSRAG